MKFLGLFLALGASLVSGAPLTLEPAVDSQLSPVQVARYVNPTYYPAYYPGYVYGYNYWPTYNYYGSPAYDYVYLNQVYPGYFHPTLIGGQRPVYPGTTQQPIPEVDDGIEKLDEKVDPNVESTSHPNDDEDTVTIDAAA